MSPGLVFKPHHQAFQHKGNDPNGVPYPHKNRVGLIVLPTHRAEQPIIRIGG